MRLKEHTLPSIQSCEPFLGTTITSQSFSSSDVPHRRPNPIAQCTEYHCIVYSVIQRQIRQNTVEHHQYAGNMLRDLCRHHASVCMWYGSFAKRFEYYEFQTRQKPWTAAEAILLCHVLAALWRELLPLNHITNAQPILCLIGFVIEQILNVNL